MRVVKREKNTFGLDFSSSWEEVEVFAPIVGFSNVVGVEG